MRNRCYTPTCKQFKNYGARGITVCERWRDSFENFFADMGLRPSLIHSLDRREVNGNYEPSNCRWATPTEQCLNRRNNHWVEVRGERLVLVEAIRRFAVVARGTVDGRIRRGWSIEEALFLPVGERR